MQMPHSACATESGSAHAAEWATAIAEGCSMTEERGHGHCAR
jgi:hypothetical protein